MKISYECGPCFLRQAREAMDLSTDDEMLKMSMDFLEKKNGKAVSEISNESIIFKADRESALTICSLIAKLLKA